MFNDSYEQIVETYVINKHVLKKHLKSEIKKAYRIPVEERQAYINSCKQQLKDLKYAPKEMRFTIQ